MRQIHHWAALRVRRRDRRAPLPHLLHRRVPAAARDQLDHRRDAARCSRSSTGSPATRCPTTCCRAPGCGSRTPSCSSIPVVGTWLAFLVFGGEFPAHDILSRLFVIHVLIVPAAIAVLLGVAPRDRLAPEAHAVPRARAAPSATSSARGCGRRTRRRASACSRSSPACSRARRARADQPDLAVRPVPTGGGEHRRAARLVHGLDRGRAAPLARPCTSTSVRTTSPSSSGPRSCSRPSPSACSTCGRSSSSGSPTTTREHHLLDRPRDRPVRTALGVGVLTFYVGPAARGRPGHLGPTARRRRCRRCCGRSGSWCSCSRSLFGAFTYKFCRDLERHRHAARAAAAAEPPIGPNEPPSIDVSPPAAGTGPGTGIGRAGYGSTGCGAPGSGSSSCSCCAAPARSGVRR